MKFTRWREHKVNMDSKYESQTLGASFTFDTEVDTLPEEYTGDSAIWDYLDDELDEGLVKPARQAIRSGAVEDSHIRSIYGT